MRILLDNGSKQIDIEVENGLEPFLEILKKALVVIDYTEADLIREWSTKEE